MKEKILNIKSAVYMGSYKRLVQFENGELRVADFSDVSENEMGGYSDLKNENYFKTKYAIVSGTIEWENGYDVEPDCLYKTSKPVRREKLIQIAA